MAGSVCLGSSFVRRAHRFAYFTAMSLCGNPSEFILVCLSAILYVNLTCSPCNIDSIVVKCSHHPSIMQSLDHLCFVARRLSEELSDVVLLPSPPLIPFRFASLCAWCTVILSHNG